MPEWERTVVDEVALRLQTHPYWGAQLAPWYRGYAVGFTWHLAIFIEPFLSFVLDGTKKIESRFSINEAAPYRRVQKGDVVLIKASGGPVVGVAEVKQATFYQLDAEGLDGIRSRFGDALCIYEEAFWETRKDACYATLIELANVSHVDPVECDKKDKRGWVTLRYQPVLQFM
jgi:ASC-1-like (ASCH) protein